MKRMRDGCAVRQGKTDNILLQVEGLSVCFYSSLGTVAAIREVSFLLPPGKILAVIGESGSGKSTLARAIVGLIEPPGEIKAGRVLFEGVDLLRLLPAGLRALRGKEISMVFQDPMTSFDPLWTIGDQFVEFILAHEKVSARQARQMAVEMMRRAQLPEAERLLKLYPFQLSGGMRQRVMIAMAMALNPKLLIADEPTTALDATVQAEIIQEMRGLQKETGSAIVLITHDPGVAAEMADLVMVMYGGRVVEWGDVWSIYDRPAHPYTVSLQNVFAAEKEGGRKKLPVEKHVRTKETTIEYSSGVERCAFLRRCPYVSYCCMEKLPPLLELEQGHKVACWHPLSNTVTTGGERGERVFAGGYKPA